jgi:hypothetical protein
VRLPFRESSAADFLSTLKYISEYVVGGKSVLWHPGATFGDGSKIDKDVSSADTRCRPFLSTWVRFCESV